MESGLFNVDADMAAGRSSVATDGFSLQTIQTSPVQFDSIDLNNQHQLVRYSMLSSLQGEPVNDLPENTHMVNRATVVESSDVLVMSLGRDSSPGASQPAFQGQFVRVPPISSTLWVERKAGLQENLNNLAISGPSIFPPEVLRSYVSDDCSSALNSSFTAPSMNYGSDEVLANMNVYGDFNRLPAPTTAGFQLYPASVGTLEPISWASLNTLNLSMDNPYGSSKFYNELSLSLASSHPSMINGKGIKDQCSEVDFPGGVTCHCSKEMRLGSEQMSSDGKELSLSCSSNGTGQFSQIISGSRYLHVIQEILAQIASSSMENIEHTSFFTRGIKNGTSMPFSSSCPIERHMLLMGSDKSINVDDALGVQVDPALQKRAMEAKKTQLLTLLQAVDDQYNQCLDEIHTVVSAFHAATELDPQIHTRFALQTISFLYKSLRERISNQILAMGAYPDSDHCTREATEGSLETSYFQKQWTLLQLKKKDQLWRPQRGLPERSVSVLRAWMFQNFLHPYPRDAEKHLLAVKSGLTRSQVSNWFINARVRLWKPMIEEMYAEMNRRKGGENEDGSNGSYRGLISISNARLNAK